MEKQIADFLRETKQRVINNGANADLQDAAKRFNVESNKAQYSYNFKWMGRPVIQYPQDILAMQELIWEIRPDLIVETGIAHGGSLIFYASMLELIGGGEVLGIDVDIREHNRQEIERHPMFKRITMIEGSSIESGVVDKVKSFATGKEKIMVVLDSNHTHDHVLAELNAYSPLVSLNSYIVVFDTIVEYLPNDYLPGQKRPWGVGNNPLTAVKEFISSNPNFHVDKEINDKLLISVAPDGYLKRTN